jgi:hypothetical protein
LFNYLFVIANASFLEFILGFVCYSIEFSFE